MFFSFLIFVFIFLLGSQIIFLETSFLDHVDEGEQNREARKAENQAQVAASRRLLDNQFKILKFAFFKIYNLINFYFDSFKLNWHAKMA
jgi:hypothetical protein